MAPNFIRPAFARPSTCNKCKDIRFDLYEFGGVREHCKLTGMLILAPDAPPPADCPKFGKDNPQKYPGETYRCFAVEEIPEFTWNTFDGLLDALRRHTTPAQRAVLTIIPKDIPIDLILQSNAENPRHIAEAVREHVRNMYE